MEPADFHATVATAIDAFEWRGGSVLDKLRHGGVTIDDYHQLLCRLFHQVQASSSSFALAGACMAPTRFAAKQYLFKHATEEASHWQWILSDLQTTGYSGTSPADRHPHRAADVYIAFNHHVAATFPLGRLGIAAVLEGIGAALGTRYGQRLARTLALRPDQMVFFAGHGETDAVHSVELRAAIEAADPSPAEWQRMSDLAATAGELYAAINASDT